jgi:hypothetical protein
MRQAGAEGVAEPIAAFIRRLEADAHDRARSADQARTDRDQLHAAASYGDNQPGHDAGPLQRMAGRRALISIAVIFVAAWIWRWAEEPKIETTPMAAPRVGTPKSGCRQMGALTGGSQNDLSRLRENAL